MLSRPALMALATTLLWMDGAAAMAEAVKPTAELLGPVRSVTIKSQGYVETELYDETGRLVEAVIHLAHANTSTHYLFRYDHQGNLLEEVAIDPGGRLLYRKRFAYARDVEGRITASVAASDEGEIQHVEFFLYDRFGNVAEQLLFHDTTAHRNLYDVLGRVVYSARYNKGDLFSEVRYRYDGGGRLKELVSYNADGVMTGRIVNEQDNRGRRIRATTEKFQTGARRAWMTTFEYDDWGNWIREVTSEISSSPEAESSSNQLVQERVIEYYGN